MSIILSPPLRKRSFRFYGSGQPIFTARSRTPPKFSAIPRKIPLQSFQCEYLYKYIIHDISKKINTFLRNGPKKYTNFKIFGDNNKTLLIFLSIFPVIVHI